LPLIGRAIFPTDWAIGGLPQPGIL